MKNALMKNASAMFVMASLISASMATTSPAVAAAPPTSRSADQGIIDFCKGDLPNYPSEHLGNCVAIQSTLAHGAYAGAVPSICSFFQTVYPDVFDDYYASFSDCVRDGANFGG